MQLTRIAEITKVFIEEGLGFLTESREAAKAAESEAEAAAEIGEGEAETRLAHRSSDKELGVRLRRTLERLGPTFVKFGQLLATRVDLFGEELLAELGKLHSAVTPFATEQAREIIEAELGRPIDEVFEEFSAEPVAAASIAQVYKARLRERGEGEHGWVAVKVQRPKLEDSLLRDLEVLIDISGFIDRMVPPYRASMVHKVAQEYARRAKGELDFLSEARAIEQFTDVLRTLPQFRVPTVTDRLCSPRLLVMEWLDGSKLDTVPDAAALAELGFDPTSFARAMLRLQISMAYEHGLVHGDTHPGNIILLPTGHVGLIDFGLHGHVPRALRDKMLEMLFFQSSGRYPEAAEAFVNVFASEPGADLDGFKLELVRLMEEAANARTPDDRRITAQLVKSMRVGARYRLEAQSDLFMVLRNLTIVEGIVLRYCPSLDFDAEVETIVGDIMRRKVFGPGMREEMTALVPQVLLTLSQRPRLAERLLQLERAFVASKSLGEFLRHEQVLREAPRQATSWQLLVATLIGAVIGALLHALLMA